MRFQEVSTLSHPLIRFIRDYVLADSSSTYTNTNTNADATATPEAVAGSAAVTSRLSCPASVTSPPK